jgi:hypothetical protein
LENFFSLSLSLALALILNKEDDEDESCVTVLAQFLRTYIRMGGVTPEIIRDVRKPAQNKKMK